MRAGARGRLRFMPQPRLSSPAAVSPAIDDMGHDAWPAFQRVSQALGGVTFRMGTDFAGHLRVSFAGRAADGHIRY